MCTMIVNQVAVEGCGKGASGWFDVRQANVAYDHPFHAPLEHALTIDFVNDGAGAIGARRRGVDAHCGARVWSPRSSRAGACGSGRLFGGNAWLN
jgi:hypothetical protein